MEKLRIQYVDINEIKAYQNNAKIHTEEQVNQIVKSITEFGMNDPIAVWKNNEIIEGHGRLLACEKLGIKKVPIIRLDELSDQQRRAYMLAHNKLTMNTDFDFTILEEELGSLDFDMSDFGFDFATETEPIEIVQDELPDAPEEPMAKLGEIYQLGEHRLMCGDATDAQSVSELTDNCKVDLLLTDPPYNVNYEGGTSDKLTIMNDNMGASDFMNLLCSSFKNAFEFMKDGASFYIWHADSEGYVFRSACMASGLDVHQCLIWVKNSLSLGRQDYQWRHEPCLYGWKAGAAHSWYSGRNQTTVLEYNKPLKNDLHPTMKPVDMIAYLMQNSTKKGDVVLDLFGGSGTTLIAAEQLNRRCFMMELDPKYCDVIIQRWENLTGEKAVLINGGE